MPGSRGIHAFWEMASEVKGLRQLLLHLNITIIMAGHMYGVLNSYIFGFNL